jgi:uncharacterized membrane protein
LFLTRFPFQCERLVALVMQAAETSRTCMDGSRRADIRQPRRHLCELLLMSALSGACAACAGTAPATRLLHVQAAARAADGPQSLPANFVLSTNEPFWRARVEGGLVLLTGPQGQRRLAVERNQVLLDGRIVNARDAAGNVELRITERLCMDSMSGAMFPYTGRLAVDDGAPATGCGGPSSPER